MKTVILNANIINEGKIFRGHILIEDEIIKGISDTASPPLSWERGLGGEVIDAKGKYLLPGIIDDQVHFREPGLTHKGDIYTESRAAVAGGITSYMEMPNTFPHTLTQELLEEKFKLASQKSLANYSFYLGASNENLDEVLKTDPRNVCGIKIFMAFSSGSVLMDNPENMEEIFSKCNMLIAIHCEDQKTIQANMEEYRRKFGENIPIEMHPLIRSEEACYKASSIAVGLAKKHNTRLHVLHISTEKELELFDNKTPLKEKRITAEACVHHLWFSYEDYRNMGIYIKWNPAVKTARDREAVLQGVLENKIDIIATDHAPHTLEEKQNKYNKVASGGPLVQHSLIAMLELYHQKKISLEKITEKMSHAVAECFQIEKRGFIREEYWADLVLVDLNSPWTVDKSTILYKCGWSPFIGTTFHSRVTHTFVNGHLAYEEGKFNESKKGKRLLFDRK
ncbi:MAG: dihydroorotase [Bacteroidetes bacterium]|nr:MAG: dihydroorotase [Bacteroidota bacterium]